jgi:hypothetical protein
MQSMMIRTGNLKVKRKFEVTSILVITDIHVLWHMVKARTFTHTHIGYDLLRSWHIMFMVLVMFGGQ